MIGKKLYANEGFAGSDPIGCGPHRLYAVRTHPEGAVWRLSPLGALGETVARLLGQVDPGQVRQGAVGWDGRVTQ